MAEYVIGVDGGNSKTDVVIASTDGELLGRVRGPGVDSPLAGLDRWRRDLGLLVSEARRRANVGPHTTAAAAAYFLANVDLPAEYEVAQRELARATPAEATVVRNDALAILRAGTDRRWGVAVVAGAGINAVGVDPTGTTAGFLALGDITGDVGGGQHLGIAALGAAVRAWDGRSPATVLSATVPGHFGLATAEDVAIAVYHHEIPRDELHVLAPVVFAAAAAGDGVARTILSAFADEVAVMATALIRRLDLSRTDVDVVLGGGILRSGDVEVYARIAASVTAYAPAARVSVLDVAPVYGALVEAFELAGADPTGLGPLRATLAG